MMVLRFTEGGHRRVVDASGMEAELYGEALWVGNIGRDSEGNPVSAGGRIGGVHGIYDAVGPVEVLSENGSWVSLGDTGE